MKNYFGKEFLLLSVLFIVSFFIVCLFSGSYFVSGIDGSKIRYSKIGSDINKGNNFKNMPTGSLMFVNGFLYPYSNFGFVQSSSFYRDDINLIRTSPYHKLPIGTNDAKLILIAKKDGEFKTELNIAGKSTLPIISLVVDAKDFFDYERGIYVEGKIADFKASQQFYPKPWNKPANYYQKGNNAKRKVFFSYYDETGKHLYSSDALVCINGSATRCFPQKSLRLKASKESGNKSFEFDFFSTHKNYSSLILRNGGNDNTKALFRDMLMQTLMDPVGLMNSNFLPCNVYLNGEYWGIHFLQNRFDADFIAEEMDVKEKNVTIVGNWKLEEGSELEYNHLIRSAKNWKSDFNYKKVEEEIDLMDLADYLSGQLFFANTDWPGNNLIMYKIHGTKTQDSKWKFAFFDLDYGFGYTGSEAVSSDLFSNLLKQKDEFSILMQNLLKNDEFKSLLKERLQQLMKNELSGKNMQASIQKLSNRLEPSILQHVQRWRKPDSVEDWKYEVEKLEDFALNRSTFIQQQIDTYLK